MSTDIQEVSKLAFDRSSILRRTPEQIEADRRAQAESAERLRPLVTDSIAVSHFKANVTAEGTARRALTTINLRLAESLFWQGKFLEAASCDIQHAKAEEYIDFHEAMEKLNCLPCTCPPIQTASASSAKGLSVSARREIQRVYVAEIEKEVAFIRCDSCKKLSAQSQ